jgi:photosystem II stability/assembly factor-like uncharacterized protein
MRGVRSAPARFLASFLVPLAVVIFMGAGDSSSVSWTVQTSGLDTNLRGVSAARLHAPESVAVWASGSNGVILRSVDRGKTWKQLHVAGGETLDFRSIEAFDARTAYVMSSGEGELSRIYKTTDGGASWNLQYTDKRSAFFLDALACVSPKNCFALSDPVDGKFLLLATSDGEHWKELPRDNMPAAMPNEGAFAASGTVLLVRGADVYFATGGPAARVFHSLDFGETWVAVETPIAHGNASSGIFSIAQMGNKIVAVGGDYKDPARSDGAGAYSLDNGKSWKLAAQQPGGYRSAVAWIDYGAVAAVGPNGEDVSEDAGVHWQHSDSLDLNALVVAGYSDGWAVGPKGTVARVVNSKHPIFEPDCLREPDGSAHLALGQ